MFLRDDKYNNAPMPLADGVIPKATALHKELESRYRGSSGAVDSLMFNGGTLVSLLASGAAVVAAGTSASPVVAASLSGTATFFIAATRLLDFGGRWKWNLSRRGRYAGMIYRLNEAAYLPEQDQSLVIQYIYEELRLERAKDGLLPGSGEPVLAGSEGTTRPQDPVGQ